MCFCCLNSYLKLCDDNLDFGTYKLQLGSLSSYMRLDSAAAEAVNLLPRPDHPSKLGSIFGMLLSIQLSAREIKCLSRYIKSLQDKNGTAIAGKVRD